MKLEDYGYWVECLIKFENNIFVAINESVQIIDANTLIPINTLEVRESIQLILVTDQYIFIVTPDFLIKYSKEKLELISNLARKNNVWNIYSMIQVNNELILTGWSGGKVKLFNIIPNEIELISKL